MDSEGGLGGTSETLFGPLAVAMVGFQPQEVDTFRYFMNDMEADMVKVRRPSIRKGLVCVCCKDCEAAAMSQGRQNCQWQCKGAEKENHRAKDEVFSCAVNLL